MEPRVNEHKFVRMQRSVGIGAKRRVGQTQVRLILSSAILVMFLTLAAQWQALDYARFPVTVFTLFYFAQFILNTVSAYFGATGSIIQADPDIIQNQKDWPFMSVCVVMYKEADVVWQSVQRMRKMDYPQEKLEVIYLLELDDTETLERIYALQRRGGWPNNFKLHVHTHDGTKPRTKPAALTDMLERDGLAPESEMFVVYDAEDLPDPLQLKKAVVAMEKAQQVDSKVVCVQAMLSFVNYSHNWLTRLFGLDYSKHYQCTLPSFHRLGLFTPLGGTSNFFLTDVIRKFKWDSWNVTEDCDLGVRLKRAGLEVQVFESTTWEQALSNPKRWVRQRSRWIKGYLQTYFVHMRNPLHLLRDLGLQGFIAFQLVVGWGAFSAVINPFFWGLSITYLLTHSELIESLFPGPIYLMALISFVGGNYLYAYISLEGAIRSEQDSSAIVSLIMPIVYAPLVTIAAYKAFFEFAGSRQRAFHWAKTMHTEISKDLSVEDIAS